MDGIFVSAHEVGMAENSLSSNLKTQFEQIASKAGWPDEVIQEIEVQASEDGQVNLSYDPSMKEQIDDLEYGKFEIPPKAAIRKFTRTSDKDLSTAVINKVLDDTLFSKGVL
jgi:hypothetical protein